MESFPGNSASKHDLFWDGEFPWPFERLSDLQPGDEVWSRIESPGHDFFPNIL